MRASLIFAATLAAPLALAAPANAYRATNGMIVDQTGPQTFYVNYARVRNETAYLCAAGDFAQTVLGLPSKTQIYRASPAPRKAGEGISFTLDASKAVKMHIVTSYGKHKGEAGISIGAAVGGYCIEYRVIER